MIGPPDAADSADTLTNRANLAYWMGDAVAAGAMYAEMLPISERVLGPEHPETPAVRANLAFWSDQAEARRLQ
ncbi:tetratricopeptide repeat protein [Nonomuraea endophytica]|uniref:Tetratricopeptide repeat protein n=1 Tax=Nonomuraea endophytica TaxID=714136 RepID=A0A7W7ZZZ6_9ACTN|nr:tetratricopeptide repeat protein [Nonomuraea endophytica]MBB5076341.1 hypothetical protein [Nonomuraea endophytica]